MSKRNSILLLLAGFMPGALFAATTDTDDAVPAIPSITDYSGQTFLTVRPQFQSAMPEKTSTFHGAERSLARDCGWGGALEIVGFGGRSTKASGIGEYFMYCNKTSLSVNSSQGQLPDVDPLHFGINYVGDGAGFASNIAFSPRQTSAGVGFDYKQYLGWNEGCPKRWWFEVSFPVIWVKNQMNLVETNEIKAGAPETGTPANMVAAFKGGQNINAIFAGISGNNSSVFGFGKINDADNSVQKKTTVGDVEIKIGYVYADEATYHLEGYIGAVAPTGNKPKAEYIFEPIVGNNKHAGVMTGCSAGVEIWSGCNKDLRWEFELNSRYLFKNTQRRSFDLCGRPWSRYMLVYTSQADVTDFAPKFGINYFTQEVKVNPHFQHNFTQSFVYTHGGFQAEVGYNFWARQKETVKLDTAFPTGIAVADIFGLTNRAEFPGGGPVNLASDIGNDNRGTAATCTNDTTFAFTAPTITCGTGTTSSVGGGYTLSTPTSYQSLKATDLNLNSAASPAALTHTVYGAVAYRADNWCWPVFFNVGGSYEFSTNNAALNRWMAFGKIGVSI